MPQHFLKFSFAQSFEKREAADLLIFPYWEGDDLKRKIALQGKNGEYELFCLENEKEPRWLYLSLGKKEKAAPESIRRAFAAALKVARGKKAKSIHVLIPEIKKNERAEFIRAISEGLLLTNYVFTRLKGKSAKENSTVLVEKIGWIGLEGKEKEILEKTQAIVEGVSFVRDLVNENSDEKPPKAIAKIALSLEKGNARLKALILDKKKIEAEKMGLILAVSRASSHDPAVAILSYKGNPKSKDHVVLVGKGITYDTGGLQLKTPDNMSEMKSDMAGAAVVLGAVRTAAALNLKVNVTAIAPLAENCIGPKSYKLGDVYPSHAGKTVEVNNTDAEGRLVLADALSYAVQNLNPSCLIDVCTLTGTIIVALGEEIAGLFSNDEKIAEGLMKASAATGELLWRMPLHADYKEALKSDYGDLLNTGGREGGAVKAALFLQEFVGSVPWAHLDIAGPAFVKKPKHYSGTRGTGFALRLLVDFLERRSA